MHIYVIISIVMLLLFLLEQAAKNNKLRMILFYFASFLAVGLLAFRGNDVGGDTIHYCGYFTGQGGYYGIWETNDSFEIGFIWLCGLLMKISRTDFCLIFFTSLITMLPFVYLIWRDCKYSKILPLCLYMTVWNILSVTQTALRQNLSVSLLFFAYIFYTSENIKHKYKYILAGLFLWLSFISHTSSLLALPLLIGCSYIKLNRKMAYILTIGSLVFIMVFKNAFSHIFDLFNQLMTGVAMASHMLDTYYGNIRYALDSEISFNRLAPATFLVVLLIKMSSDGDLKSRYLKYLVIGASLYNIGASFPMMFRVVYPLLFMGILYVPSGLSKSKTLISRVLLILLILFFIRNQIVYMKPGTDDRMLPYSFIWE
ncbi:EpsG family protein [uncultured Phocaeicola sp.]|uniref:EpsG family protein n=1 Tax=uncultured Phocaeicola sp. TaxID=990718 RepID=UPI0025F07A6F|nr:EpsG family protein [uncultured Phocaeicola sp.]